MLFITILFLLTVIKIAVPSQSSHSCNEGQSSYSCNEGFMLQGLLCTVDKTDSTSFVSELMREANDQRGSAALCAQDTFSFKRHYINKPHREFNQQPRATFCWHQYRISIDNGTMFYSEHHQHSCFPICFYKTKCPVSALIYAYCLFIKELLNNWVGKRTVSRWKKKGESCVHTFNITLERKEGPAGFQKYQEQQLIYISTNIHLTVHINKYD